MEWHSKWNKRANGGVTIIILIVLLILAFLLFKGNFFSPSNGDGNTSVNTSGANFEVKINKASALSIFTLVDGHENVNEISFTITLENTGDYDFSDIRIYDATAESPTGANIGSCTTEKFIEALQAGGLWGSQGALKKGQSTLPKETGKIQAEDCRGNVDLNEVTFKIYVEADYGEPTTLKKTGEKIMTFEKEEAEDLRLYLKLDEGSGSTAYDSSEFHNDGNLNGNIKWTDDSYSGYALDSNGGNVWVADSASLKPQKQMTVEARVKIRDIHSQQSIMHKGSIFAKGWDLVMWSDGTNNRVQFRINIAGKFYNPSYNTNIEANRWYWVKGVYDGSAVSLYIDGVLVDSTPATGDIDLVTDNLIFAYSDRYGTFNGIIDEVKLTAGTEGPPPACYDSDGLDFKNKGYVEQDGKLWKWDECAPTAGLLYERFCDQWGNPSTMNKHCSDFGSNWICEDGACKEGGGHIKKCNPDKWEKVFSDDDKEHKKDTSGTCSNSIYSKYYSVPSSKDYCYKFEFDAHPGADQIWTKIDGHSWDDVEALAFVQIDTKSEEWEKNELYDFRCEYQGNDKEEVIMPTEFNPWFSSYKLGGCLWECAFSSNYGDWWEFEHVMQDGELWCAPTPEACNAIEDANYGDNCGVQCYGEEVGIKLRQTLMKKGKCEATDESSNRAKCSDEEWAEFWGEIDFDVRRTPYE